MLGFRLESWAAMAPGLESREDWKQWLKHPVAIKDQFGKIPLKSISAILRRRLSTLGRCAIGTAMPLVEEVDIIPSIFASRHGDTELTISLLSSMGRDEPMSPTSFSLAVHNAVSGLFTIARKDTSEVTSIAAMEGLTLQTFFEAIGQLESSDKVLCVIYDIPLPDFYQSHCADISNPFPYAIAMIISNLEGTLYGLEPVGQETQGNVALRGPFDSEPLSLIGLLAGTYDNTELTQNGYIWRIAKVEN